MTKTKRVTCRYFPYWDWEDFKNDMYSNKVKNDEVVKKSSELLSDDILFFSTCLDVINDWPNSSMQNLLNKSVNRRAWLGQAACNYKFKATEIETREAWKNTAPLNKIKANIAAEKIIKIYESKNRSLHKNMEEKGLF